MVIYDIVHLKNTIKKYYLYKLFFSWKILHQMVADASSNGIRFIPTYLHPKSRGTIRLKSKDPMEYPIIDPNYLYHPEDVDGLVRGRDTQSDMY